MGAVPVAGKSGRRTGAALAVVATLATVAGCTDTERSVPMTLPPTMPGTSTDSDASSVAATNPTLVVGPWIGARVTPSVVAEGDRFELVPGGAVGRTCGIALQLFTPVPGGAGELVGGVVGAGEWVPAGTTTTIPPCIRPDSDSPVAATVPAGLPAELYEVCRRGPFDPAGCGLVRVVGPVDIDGELAGATVSPSIVGPGDTVVVATLSGARVCDQYQLHGGGVGGLDFIGYTGPRGDLALSVPGATTTAPFCQPGEGPGNDVRFVVPDLPAGSYLLCLAGVAEPGSCALVEVERASGP